MYYGLELEFAIVDRCTCQPVAAYKVTHKVDGCQMIGELRTKVHDNIIDAVFEMEKLIYKMKRELEGKEYKMEIVNQVKFDKNTLKEVYADPCYRNNKYKDWRSDNLIYSVYANGKTGKILPRGVYKCALQVNISEKKRTSVSAWDINGVSQIYPREVYTIPNFVPFIHHLDNAFSVSIKEAKRIKGVYAIKDASDDLRGQRVEYRSLPATISLKQLIRVVQEV